MRAKLALARLLGARLKPGAVWVPTWLDKAGLHLLKKQKPGFDQR
jgi:hypothetical protein